MNKSSACSFLLNGKVQYKKKYLRPEAAVAQAKLMNSLPNTIHLFTAYKYTTCFFFHIGKDKTKLKDSSLFPVNNG